MTVLEKELATGTGFVVIHGAQPFLITNWHNLTGRHPETLEPMHYSGGTPDAVVINQNSSYGLGQWTARREPVLDADRRPLWREHPEHGREVDVVALPLTDLHNVQLYPYDLAPLPSELEIAVPQELSIVGFPFGLTVAGFFAIWVRGTIATEFEVDYNDLPMFLIDSRTRKGQSGSPVIFYTREGLFPVAGGLMFGTTHTHHLLGIYAGRVNKESDLGRVFKIRAIRDVIERGVRPDE
jgi:hypothetical protein